jgi:predicted metal-binding membrane protein
MSIGWKLSLFSSEGSYIAAIRSDEMHFKQAAPANSTYPSRIHMMPFVAAILLIAGGAWLALVLLARSMDLMLAMGIAMPSFVVMWTLMVAGMMVPSITPLASRYLRTIESHQPFGLIGFTAGYLGIWTSTGVLAFALAWLAGRIAATSPVAATVAAAAIFATGGIYQFTPLKDRCLARCRVPIGLLLRYASWCGSLRHVRVGVHHGAYCLGCCWSLMLLMLAFGVMNTGAMLLLAAVVTLEKVWTHGVLLSRLVGVGCCALAVAVLWMPGLAPGLILPVNGMGMPSP